MKLSTAILSLFASSATAMSIKGKNNVAKVLKAARRVEEAQEEENAYLAKYTLKLVGCKAGETVVNPENGEYEYNAVVVRLCPSESGCDDDSTNGCKAGHGDYVVGLNTYVNAFFEDQRDNMQWDDNFEVDRYAQCEEYNPENDDDADKWQNYQFFIGPTCAEEGLDIKLALYQDEACTYESEVTFEEISNGWTLPYSSGGLVSTQCTDCLAYNDNGEYELREMCEQLYEQSAAKCEQEMEYYSYYGQNNNGCEYIEELMPRRSQGGAGKVFGWIIFVALIAGLAGYVVWWRKKKSGASDGLVA